MKPTDERGRSRAAARRAIPPSTASEKGHSGPARDPAGADRQQEDSRGLDRQPADSQGFDRQPPDSQGFDRQPADSQGPDRQPPDRPEALHARAKQSLSRTANELRDLAHRSRVLHGEMAGELRLRRREDQEAGPSDDAAGTARRRRLDQLAGEVLLRRSELARLDLVAQGLEANWLFLERGGDPAVGLPGGTDPALRMIILEAQESERARLAQEIHDGPAQALANAIFQVDILRRTLQQEPAAAQDEMRGLRDLLRRELADLRGFINQLRPPLLEELGLDRALSESAAQMAGAGGLAVEVDLRAPGDLLSEARQTVVLRVAQEALRNVRKHADAHRVRLATRFESREGDPPRWILEVDDDGRGFEVMGPFETRDGQHFGLRFMRERADMIGAQLSIEAAVDSGTTVRLTITLN